MSFLERPSVTGRPTEVLSSTARVRAAQPLSIWPSRTMTKTASEYKIEVLGRNRGHVSFQTMLDKLEVSPATLKRDLDYLKDQLGAPIVFDRFLNGFKFGEEYRAQKQELPGLWLSEVSAAHQLAAKLASLVASHRLCPLCVDGAMP